MKSKWWAWFQLRPAISKQLILKAPWSHWRIHMIQKKFKNNFQFRGKIQLLNFLSLVVKLTHL